MKLRLVVMVLALIALSATAVGGYLFYRYERELAYLETEGELASETESAKQHVEDLVSFYQGEVRVLAGFEELKDALLNRNTETLVRADRILDHFAEGGNVGVCYLLDRSGNTIASSNRNQPDSFVGRNYSFRPYFDDAIQGRLGTYLAVGTTSRRRGIYVSHPVYAPGIAEPVGVAVLKMSVGNLEREIAQGGKGVTLLAHTTGMIFVSSKEDWNLNLLWRVLPANLAEIAKTKQFGQGPWNWTGLERKSDNEAFDASGQGFLVQEAVLENCPGWKIVNLYSLKALYRRLAGALFGTTGYIAVFLFISMGAVVVVLYRMILQEIRNRKLAEDALIQSEEKFRLMFDHSPLGVFHFDTAGTITACNDNFVRIIGSSREKIVGLNAIKDIKDEKMIASIKEALSGNIGHYEDYYSSVTANKVTPVDCRFGPIMDQDGQIVGGVGIIEDLTDRKRAREDRKHAEEELNRLFTALEQAGETIVITDPSGAIQYVNPSFEVTTGYKSEEVMGKTLTILDADTQDKLFHEDMWKVLNRGEVWRGRFTNRKKDGTPYEETATISPVRDDSGRIVNYVAVERDITKEVMLQNQLLLSQKMEAVGTLAGGIAHDFNNLLQAIVGCTDVLLMQKTQDDPDLKKLKMIRHAAQDGADLVSRILAFSRQTESKVRPTNLNDEILRIESLVRRSLTKMVDVKLVLADDLDIIDADPTQIEQMVLNLAVNARQAMPDGGQLLIETNNVSLGDEYLLTHLGAKAGRYVLLTISDTGAGMTPEVLERIFEPFFTTKTDGEGTGLGLAMVHGIVAQHKAYIRCYSEPGTGTAFKIYFPVSSTDLLADMAMTRQMPAFGTETILLVDDDERLREMGAEILSMVGYKVLGASSGEDALAIYSCHVDEIALVVLDLIMPGMGGKRCLEEILRVNPNAKVIIASGYSADGFSLGGKGVRARGFIRKPYDTKDLLIAIRRILDQEES